MQKENSSRILMKRLLVVCALVVFVAATVVWLSMDSARKVSSRADQLISHHLPELSAISTLQSIMNERVIQLYLYYATMQPENRKQKVVRHTLFEKSLNYLQLHVLHKSEVAILMNEVAQFNKMAETFDVEMQSGFRRDWDVLRETLASAQIQVDQLDKLLQKWGKNIRKKAAQGGELTLQEVTRQQQLQTGFSLGVLGITLFALFSLYARNKDQNELFRRAYQDPLSNLPNRASLYRHWQTNMLEDPEDTRYVLLLVRLDRFQLFTSTFGHPLGDQLTLSVSGWFKTALTELDGKTELFHFAPASWVVLVTETDCNSAGLSVVGALLDLAVTPIRLQDRELSVTCSIGMAAVTGHGQSLDGLLKHADTALRNVMLSGGSSYLEYNDAMDNEAEQMLSIENDLRQAIQKNELELFYQPKINSVDSRIVCAEALLRWRKQDELISPGVFIPIAEQTALIIPVGEWVLRAACEQWKQWSEAGLSCVPVAVNISAQQFRLADFPAQVKAILDSSGMPPHMLELEITEEAATGDQQQG